MSCPKCDGWMLYQLDEEAWRCLNCGRRDGFQPVFLDELAEGISRRGNPIHRERVSRGMRASWASRKGEKRPSRGASVATDATTQQTQ